MLTGVYRLPLGSLPGQGVRVLLDDIGYSVESFMIYAFVDLAEGEVDTAGPDHPAFADVFSMYGRGSPLTRAHETMTFELAFHVSPALARSTSPGSELVLVFKDFGGQRVAAPAGWQPGRITVEPAST